MCIQEYAYSYTNPAQLELTSYINSTQNRKGMDLYIMHRITDSIGANMRMESYQLHLKTSAYTTYHSNTH